jgi:hypothetical protein
MPPKWWSNGIRFECQGSGKCCVSRGTTGYVYLTLVDRQRLAKFFELSTREFTRRYCAKTHGQFHLVDTSGPCQFLDGTRCSVYEGRPTQCRTWPFWPENMSPKAWSRDVAGFCPGVGKGRLWTAAEIQGELDKG